VSDDATDDAAGTTGEGDAAGTSGGDETAGTTGEGEAAGGSGEGAGDGGRPCPRCGTAMYRRHCKYVCPQHGVVYDCSDTFWG
jgi:hypothetical protein